MQPKILVVDDEPDVVELICFNLRRHGYEVLSATDGLEGLLKARRVQPDLVMLDVMMAGMDGLTVCEILARQPSTKDIPVIIVTAATGEMARLNSFAAGAVDFICKPFTPGDLVRRVGQVLQRVSTQRAAASGVDG
jgi:DNA-binding response OmpR family regulator